MDESRDNNKSLMNLKECVRAKAKMAQEDGFIHVPWRSNKLTMLLKVSATRIPLIPATVMADCCPTRSQYSTSSRASRQRRSSSHMCRHTYRIPCIVRTLCPMLLLSKLRRPKTAVQPRTMLRIHGRGTTLRHTLGLHSKSPKPRASCAWM